jgi:hypothetical protein
VDLRSRKRWQAAAARRFDVVAFLAARERVANVDTKKQQRGAKALARSAVLRPQVVGPLTKI